MSSEALARLARIHSVDGTVYLKRAEWSEFTAVSAGTALYGDDLLKPDLNSTVVITCPDGERSDNPPTPGLENSVNESCPGTPRSDVRPDFGVSEVWGGSDLSIPFVLTPRTDFVLSATPTLRWNPVSGATTYTVALTTPQGTVWQVTTDQATLPYPENEPELMADSTLYELLVTVDAGTASTDEGLDLKFIRIFGSDVSAAEAEIAQVQAMDLPDDIKILVLVEEVYPKYSLTGEAISDLLTLIEDCTETAHIYRLLGDLYVKSGLQIPAEESYQKALEFAAMEENLEEETLAYLGLGTLYQAISDQEKALETLQQAKAVALSLGNAKLVASIESQLSGL
ncbi:MAG: tetratricopeptide repeat protein [Leptolyngbya sp. SIO1D8]|nr:tetratricopeptide repeat protein [Leptolyngbya sp. SIO1D8]